MPDWGVRVLATLAASVLLCEIAAADDQKAAEPVTDAELLEFLGSVDSGADSQAAADDGSWIDYLAQTDIGKVARTADPTRASRKEPATDEKPPASGDKKDD